MQEYIQRSIRENFVQTFLERDIPQLGFNIPAQTLRRLWQMLAHNHGQQMNSSRLREALGLSHTTIRSYIDLLTQALVIRLKTIAGESGNCRPINQKG